MQNKWKTTIYIYKNYTCLLIIHWNNLSLPNDTNVKIWTDRNKFLWLSVVYWVVSCTKIQEQKQGLHHSPYNCNIKSFNEITMISRNGMTTYTQGSFLPAKKYLGWFFQINIMLSVHLRHKSWDWAIPIYCQKIFILHPFPVGQIASHGWYPKTPNLPKPSATMD